MKCSHGRRVSKKKVECKDCDLREELILDREGEVKVVQEIIRDLSTQAGDLFMVGTEANDDRARVFRDIVRQLEMRRHRVELELGTLRVHARTDAAARKGKTVVLWLPPAPRTRKADG